MQPKVRGKKVLKLLKQLKKKKKGLKQGQNMPFSKMIRNLKINGFNSLSKGHKVRLKVVMHPLTSAVRSPRHVDHCVLSNMVYTARYRRAKIMSLSTNKQTNKDHTDYQVGLAIIICFADSKKYTQPSNINIGNEYALLF